MSKIFYPTSEKLKFLLESIHNREVALPDFQRDFVWDPGATEELVESLCQNFPAGSLLRIKNGAGFHFAPREFQGAPVLNSHAPSYLILDGQQRLTSLYQALYGVGDHRYYLDMQGLLDDRDLEDCVFYTRRKEGQKRFGSMEQQAAALTFPFERVYGRHGGFEEWLDGVLELRPESPDEKRDLKHRLREARKAWLQPVEDYEFPMVTLAEETKSAAVCTIFETLNRRGVKLTAFDLLSARFWPEGVRLRDLWEEAQVNHPLIADFDVDPYYVLQAVAMRTAATAPSCKRSAVLEMKVQQIRDGWEPVVNGLAEGLHILRDDCGVVLPDWLPYQTIIVSVAVAMAEVVTAKGPEVAALKNKFKRWFWCSVFGQTYDRAANTQTARDVVELKKWFSGGEPPETVTRFKFDGAVLRDITPRQRAFYRALIAVILRNGSRDFHKGDRMTAHIIREKKIDDHHVFPQDFLKKHMPEVDPALRDSVLNHTLIDKVTNIVIRNRAPSKYLRDIQQSVGDEGLRAILRSHLLPDGPDSPLWSDDFEGFLAARQELLAAKVREVTL